MEEDSLMRKLAFIAAASVAALVAPGLAHAQEGAYVGAGYTQFDADDVSVGAVTGRAGYRFHPNFAAEAEASFGVGDDDGVELDNSVGVYGVGILPVSPEFDLFARVGYHNTEFNAGEDDGIAYGAGAQWNITERFGIRGEYTRLDSDEEEVDTYGASVVYKFGR
jgi:opacity protein-like surface antigen